MMIVISFLHEPKTAPSDFIKVKKDCYFVNETSNENYPAYEWF